MLVWFVIVVAILIVMLLWSWRPAAQKPLEDKLALTAEEVASDLAALLAGTRGKTAPTKTK